MSRKKNGSKAFKRCQDHRKNYINWAVNQLDLTNVRQINTENIKYLNKGKRTSRVLGSWVYRDIFDKLSSFSFEQGVLDQKIGSTYTSQRCSVCGWTRKSNRKGKKFKCDQCGFHTDSDLNASLNLALSLIPISDQQRLKKANIKGFYWLSLGQAPIVPAVQETQSKTYIL
jgi:transposase